MWSKLQIKQQKPRREELPRAAASAVPGKYRRAALWALLGLAALSVALSLALRGNLAGAVMLFTQKSVHTLAGALRAAGSGGAPAALLLAAFQAVALPWLPRLLPLANGMVFGGAGGFALSLLGTVLGGSLCFGMSRLLLRPLAARLEPPPLGRWAADWGGMAVCAALLLIPGATGFVGYLSGVSALPFRRYLPWAAVGEAVTLLAAAWYTSPYRTLLPNAARLGLAALALLLLCGAGIRQISKKRGTL